MIYFADLVFQESKIQEMSGPKSSKAKEREMTVIRGGAPKSSKRTGHFRLLMATIRWVLELRHLVWRFFPVDLRFDILAGII